MSHREPLPSFAGRLRLFKRRVKRGLILAVYYLNSGRLLMMHGFKKKKLLVLYLYADTEKYPDTFDRLCRKILRHLPGFEVTIIKIDNFNETKPPTRLADGVFDIAGDNSFWEFSGWGRGMAYTRENNLRADVVLFLNDAFLNRTHHLEDEFHFLTRFNTISLYDLRDRVIGCVDHYHDSQFELLGHDVSRWIRSNIFAVPFDAAVRIPWPCLSREEIDRLLPAQYGDDLFDESVPMNPALRKFLKYWMASGWEQSRSINRDNWPFVRAKLAAILNERMLTVVIRKMGLGIVDIREGRIVSRGDLARARIME